MARAAGAVLVVAWTAIALAAVSAQAAALPAAELVLTPARGSAGTAFTATYQLSRDHCLEFAKFFWDGSLVGSARIDSSTCTAVIRLAPPPAAASGPHTVGAEGCHGFAFEEDCDPDTSTAGSTAYTIDGVAATGTGTTQPTITPAPTAEPTPTATGTPAPTGTATGTPTPRPTAAPTPTPAPATPTPVPTRQPTPPPTPPPPPPTVVPAATPSPTVTPAPTAQPTAIAKPTPSPAPTLPRPTASRAPGRPSPTPQPAIPTAGPTATVRPTATPAPSPSPTVVPPPTPSPASPTPGPSGSGGVLPAIGTPAPSVPPAPPLNPRRRPASPRQDDIAAFVAAIPTGFVLDPKVIATNLALTLLFIFLFGLTSEVFNSTLDENRTEIEGWVGRLTSGPLRVLAPLAWLDARLDSLTERGRLGTVLHGSVVLALTGIVYGFLSPDFGLNRASLALFGALVVGLGLLTYVDEGATVLLAARRQCVPSAVRMYGTAIAVAVVCVTISRLVGFTPGFVYGFIASAVILAPVTLGRRQHAQLVIVPSLIVLGVSVAAWMLLVPVRAALDAGNSWPLSLVESILAITYVAGLEGLFFSLIPLHFLDGAVVMRWSRIAWAATFGTVTFLWWQLLLNRDGEYADAFKQTDVQIVIAALLVFMVTTGGVWLFFRGRERSEEPIEEPIRGGEA